MSALSDIPGLHVCRHCEMVCATQSDLHAHIKRAHKSLAPLRCPYCQREYSDRHRYDIHLRLHTGERPFKCEICGKGFREKRKCNLHMLRHTSSLQHKCHLCPRSFEGPKALEKHVNAHKNNRTIRPRTMIKPDGSEAMRLSIVTSSNQATVDLRGAGVLHAAPAPFEMATTTLLGSGEVVSSRLSEESAGTTVSLSVEELMEYAQDVTLVQQPQDEASALLMHQQGSDGVFPVCMDEFNKVGECNEFPDLLDSEHQLAPVFQQYPHESVQAVSNDIEEDEFDENRTFATLSGVEPEYDSAGLGTNVFVARKSTAPMPLATEIRPDLATKLTSEALAQLAKAKISLPAGTCLVPADAKCEPVKSFSQAAEMEPHAGLLNNKQMSITIQYKVLSAADAEQTITKQISSEFPQPAEYCNRGDLNYKHQDREEDEAEKECSICNLNFPTEVQMRSHFRRHGKQHPFKCEACGVAYKRRDLLDAHMRMHTDEEHFSCEICGKELPSEKKKRMHKQKHARDHLLNNRFHAQTSHVAGAKINTFLESFTASLEGPVDQSSSAPSSDSGLDHQLVSDEQNSLRLSVDTNPEDFVTLTNKAAESSKSLSDPITTQTETNLDWGAFKRKWVIKARHLRSSRKQRLRRISSVYSALKRSHPSWFKGLCYYECILCSRRLNSEASIVIHKLLHHEGKSWRCQFCSEMYAQRRDLKDHLQSKHRMSNTEIRMLDMLNQALIFLKCKRRIATSGTQQVQGDRNDAIVNLDLNTSFNHSNQYLTQHSDDATAHLYCANNESSEGSHVVATFALPADLLQVMEHNVDDPASLHAPVDVEDHVVEEQKNKLIAMVAEKLIMDKIDKKGLKKVKKNKKKEKITGMTPGEMEYAGDSNMVMLSDGKYQALTNTQNERNQNNESEHFSMPILDDFAEVTPSAEILEERDASKKEAEQEPTGDIISTSQEKNNVADAQQGTIVSTNSPQSQSKDNDLEPTEMETDAVQTEKGNGKRVSDQEISKDPVNNIHNETNLGKNYSGDRNAEPLNNAITLCEDQHIHSKEESNKHSNKEDDKGRDDGTISGIASKTVSDTVENTELLEPTLSNIHETEKQAVSVVLPEKCERHATSLVVESSQSANVGKGKNQGDSYAFTQNETIVRRETRRLTRRLRSVSESSPNPEQSRICQLELKKRRNSSTSVKTFGKEEEALTARIIVERLTYEIITQVSATVEAEKETERKKCQVGRSDHIQDRATIEKDETTKSHLKVGEQLSLQESSEPPDVTKIAPSLRNNTEKVGRKRKASKPRRLGAIRVLTPGSLPRSDNDESVEIKDFTNSIEKTKEYEPPSNTRRSTRKNPNPVQRDHWDQHQQPGQSLNLRQADCRVGRTEKNSERHEVAELEKQEKAYDLSRNSLTNKEKGDQEDVAKGKRVEVENDQKPSNEEGTQKRCKQPKRQCEEQVKGLKKVKSQPVKASAKDKKKTNDQYEPPKQLGRQTMEVEHEMNEAKPTKEKDLNSKVIEEEAQRESANGHLQLADKSTKSKTRSIRNKETQQHLAEVENRENNQTVISHSNESNVSTDKAEGENNQPKVTVNGRSLLHRKSALKPKPARKHPVKRRATGQVTENAIKNKRNNGVVPNALTEDRVAVPSGSTTLPDDLCIAVELNESGGSGRVRSRFICQICGYICVKREKINLHVHTEHYEELVLALTSHHNTRPATTDADTSEERTSKIKEDKGDELQDNRCHGDHMSEDQEELAKKGEVLTLKSDTKKAPKSKKVKVCHNNNRSEKVMDKPILQTTPPPDTIIVAESQTKEAETLTAKDTSSIEKDVSQITEACSLPCEERNENSPNKSSSKHRSPIAATSPYRTGRKTRSGLRRSYICDTLLVNKLETRVGMLLIAMEQVLSLKRLRRHKGENTLRPEKIDAFKRLRNVAKGKVAKMKVQSLTKEMIVTFVKRVDKYGETQSQLPTKTVLKMEQEYAISEATDTSIKLRLSSSQKKEKKNEKLSEVKSEISKEKGNIIEVPSLPVSCNVLTVSISREEDTSQITNLKKSPSPKISDIIESEPQPQLRRRGRPRLLSKEKSKEEESDESKKAKLSDTNIGRHSRRVATTTSSQVVVADAASKNHLSPTSPVLPSPAIVPNPPTDKASEKSTLTPNDTSTSKPPIRLIIRPKLNPTSADMAVGNTYSVQRESNNPLRLRLKSKPNVALEASEVTEKKRGPCKENLPVTNGDDIGKVQLLAPSLPAPKLDVIDDDDDEMIGLEADTFAHVMNVIDDDE